MAVLIATVLLLLLLGLLLLLTILRLVLLLALEAPASPFPPSPISTHTSSAGRLNAAGVHGMRVHHPIHRRRLASHIIFDLVI